jgi:peptide/nickel transport system substrate-binding protein
MQDREADVRMRTGLSVALAVASIVIGAGVATTRQRRAASSNDSRYSNPTSPIVASIRAEPRSFNRYTDRDLTTTVVTYLLHSGLVRVNRVTDQLEPELAESWQLLDDKLTFRIRLRKNLRFSDGVPFTAHDVAFSFAAIYDARTESIVADSLQVGGQPLTVRAEDDLTVAVRFPTQFGPGLRLLDGIPIFPRHKLEAALKSGAFREAWGPSTAPADLVGLGPFVLTEYQPGQRLIFARNQFYWRRDRTEQLPRASQVVLEVMRDQDAEALALQNATIDFSQSELRPVDVAALTRAAAARRISVTDLGVGMDGDLFWINLGPSKARDRRSRWLQQADFRRAIAHAIDRDQFVNTVYLGAGLPGFGVVSPGNRQWYVDSGEPRFNLTEAKRLLASLNLSTHDDALADSDGSPVRFTLLTQYGNTSLERGASAIREGLSRVGVRVDVVALEAGALIQRLMSGDYDAAYFRLLTTDTDPALNPDFWRSSGSAHVWNPAQRRPSTAWESEIDRLMNQLSASLDAHARWQAFAQIQAIMAREVPAMCFAFPRLSFAMSTRLTGATPAAFRPPLLWNPAVIGVNPPSD